jgi:type III pantothenate kinase
MLWAIDVGNTHAVFGLWDGRAWRATWRLDSHAIHTEDQLAATLAKLCDLASLPFEADGVVVASVVPPVNEVIERFGEKWLGVEPKFLSGSEDFGIEVLYDPPAAVGADRIANALGALALAEPPIVVVDFGTATTFDGIDAEGRYVGGGIMPGIEVSLEALTSHTAKLPSIELKPPKRAVGKTTAESMQAGIVLGYAGGIDAVVRRMAAELGARPAAIATGGLGKLLCQVCETLERYEPNLTLDGLRIAWERCCSDRPPGAS